MFLKKANLSHIDPLAGLFDAYRVFYGKDANLEAAKLFLTQRIVGDESVIYIALSARYEALGFVQLYPLYS